MPTRYDPDIHHRRAIRLRGWDYRDAGAYFVTICTHGGQPLFGDVADGTMRLNEYGEIVAACWRDLPRHHPHVELDAFVVMPNHVHGIIVIRGDACGRGDACVAPTADGPRGPIPQSLGAIIGSFKSACTRRINEMRGTPGAPVWQRNYYDRIIRNDREWNAIREYIQNNPITWERDAENPDIPVGTRRPGPQAWASAAARKRSR
ncbi:MAG: transposase [Chloroflexi bacterium]|nr:transposase [Chloroflexota bacterium]